MASMRISGSSPARPGSGSSGRVQILRAAADAFMDHGYDRTSIDEIADRLGATKGRVYHYYRSKVDILLDIHIDILSIMETEALAIAKRELPPLDKLRSMAQTHTRLMMEHISFARVAMISTAMRDLAHTEKQRETMHSIRLTRAAYEDLYRDLIQQAVDAGELRELDVDIAARGFLGAINWVGMWFRPEKASPVTITTISEELAAFAVAGLTA